MCIFYFYIKSGENHNSSLYLYFLFMGGRIIKIKKTIIIIIIFVLILSIDSLGKYYKEFNLESNNNISKAIISVENDLTLNINSIENKAFFLKVKNYNDDKISEVDIEYNFKIFVNNNFLIKIYKNEEEIKQNNNETEKCLLSKNIKQEDIFKIEIIFLDNSDQEINDEIKMKIYYEQVNI